MTFPGETPRWRRYLRFWRADVQRDIDDELRFHFETRIEDLTAQGMSEAAARAQAVEEFGDVAQVRTGLVSIGHRAHRARANTERLGELAGDLAYAARTLRRTPGLAIGILVTLALGVGANAAMFTLLETIFLRPPGGVVAPDGVRRVWAERNYSDGVQFSQVMSYQQYAAIADAVAGRAQATVYSPAQQTKIGSGESQRHAQVGYAPASYFTLLGARTSLGRIYSGGEDLVSNPSNVAVVSDAYWRRELGGDSTVIGQPIDISGRMMTIVGVASPSFTGTELDAADIWIALGSYGRTGGSTTPWWKNNNVNGLVVLVRPTTNAHDPEIEQRITQALRRPGVGWSGDSLTVARLGSIITANGPGVRGQEVQIAVRLAGVAIIVLLIACANVANLLLARGVRRRREIAVRLALGISRGRLIRLLMAEVMLLAMATAVLSIWIAQFGGSALRRLLFPEIHWAHSATDWSVVLFAMGSATAAGLVAGLVPALQAASPTLTSALKSAGEANPVHRSRLRSGLVIAQAALSVLLLVGAGLFVRSLSNVRGLDIGFDARRLITASVHYDNASRNDDPSLPQRMAALSERIARLPGIEKTALTSTRPMYSFSTISYYTDTDSLGSREHWMPTVTGVSRGYFDAAGLRILHGVDFEPLGSASNVDVIVNEVMAKRMWPGRSAVGECLRLESRNAPCRRIRAVVQNSRMGKLIEDPEPKFYISLDHVPNEAQRFVGAYYVAVRATPSRAAAVMGDIRGLIHQEFPTGIAEVVRLSDYMEPQFRPWQLGATLFAMFGVLALVVAGIGIYSTVAYTASQRTHEFGVRLALGAHMTDVLRLVIGSGLRLVAIGVAAGVLLALAGGRLIATLLYGVAPSDPVVLVVVATTLLGIAVIASALPARRAARVDPVTALRAD